MLHLHKWSFFSFENNFFKGCAKCGKIMIEAINLRHDEPLWNYIPLEQYVNKPFEPILDVGQINLIFKEKLDKMNNSSIGNLSLIDQEDFRGNLSLIEENK